MSLRSFMDGNWSGFRNADTLLTPGFGKDIWQLLWLRQHLKDGCSGAFVLCGQESRSDGSRSPENGAACHVFISLIHILCAVISDC